MDMGVLGPSPHGKGDVPGGDLRLRAGAKVLCSDGPLGTLEGAHYDALSGAPLRLRVGAPGLAEPLSLPAGSVLEADEEEIHLGLTLGEALGEGRGEGEPVPVGLRPLWYRLAWGLEPLRPLFAWAVRHRQVVKLVGLIMFMLGGSLLSALLGRWAGERLARRLGK
jgi:hypothetical protein